MITAAQRSTLRKWRALVLLVLVAGLVGAGTMHGIGLHQPEIPDTVNIHPNFIKGKTHYLTETQETVFSWSKIALFLSLGVYFVLFVPEWEWRQAEKRRLAQAPPKDDL